MAPDCQHSGNCGFPLPSPKEGKTSGLLPHLFFPTLCQDVEWDQHMLTGWAVVGSTMKLYGNWSQ